MGSLVVALALTTLPLTVYAQEDAADRVEFSFDDAPLVELVQYVARLTHRRFIVPAEAQSVRVTVISGAPVTRTELYRGLVSVLAMNGFTVIRTGAYERIVPSEGVVGRATDVVTEQSALPSPRVAGEQVVTYLHHVPDGGSLDDMVELLSHFSSPGGHVAQHGPTRTLIMTDTAAHLARMLAILRETRTDSAEPSIFIEPLDHADAEALAETLRATLPSD